MSQCGKTIRLSVFYINFRYAYTLNFCILPFLEACHLQLSLTSSCGAPGCYSCLVEPDLSPAYMAWLHAAVPSLLSSKKGAASDQLHYRPSGCRLTVLLLNEAAVSSKPLSLLLLCNWKGGINSVSYYRCKRSWRISPRLEPN